MEIAVLAGGCFWCLEAVFQQLEGVEAVLPGYCGGHVANPTYEQLCSGRTGHAEVVQITFDPGQISFHDLLKIFFAIHDPTTLNRQGNDVGTQYRSVIFCQSSSQERVAVKIIAELESTQIWSSPFVTNVESAMTFFPAEAYHQGYFHKNPGQGYCDFIIAPKLAKFRKEFLQRLKLEYR